MISFFTVILHQSTGHTKILKRDNLLNDLGKNYNLTIAHIPPSSYSAEGRCSQESKGVICTKVVNVKLVERDFFFFFFNPKQRRIQILIWSNEGKTFKSRWGTLGGNQFYIENIWEFLVIQPESCQTFIGYQRSKLAKLGKIKPV